MRYSLTCPKNTELVFRYFEDDEDEGEEGGDNLEYQPAPDSPGAADTNKANADSDNDSVDPLDAFMEGINVSL